MSTLPQVIVIRTYMDDKQIGQSRIFVAYDSEQLKENEKYINVCRDNMGHASNRMKIVVDHYVLKDSVTYNGRYIDDTEV